MYFIFVLDLGEAVSGMAVDDHISDPEEDPEPIIHYKPKSKTKK
jgi:hypothetical protein